MNLCFVITQYHGRSLSTEVDSTISPNIAIIQLEIRKSQDLAKDWGERQVEKKICKSKNFKLYIKT